MKYSFTFFTTDEERHRSFTPVLHESVQLILRVSNAWQQQRSRSFILDENMFLDAKGGALTCFNSSERIRGQLRNSTLCSCSVEASPRQSPTKLNPSVLQSQRNGQAPKAPTRKKLPTRKKQRFIEKKEFHRTRGKKHSSIIGRENQKVKQKQKINLISFFTIQFHHLKLILSAPK